MMKILAWIGSLIFVLFGAVYVVAFTPFGNNVVKSMIETKIANEVKLDAKLQTFHLSMSDFEVLLELNKRNTILLKGNYSLFSQAFNVAYRVDLQELKTLKSLTGMKLNDSFSSDGRVVGDIKYIKVDGVSNVAKSVTKYHVKLKEFKPTSIIAKISHADLKSILHLLNQKQYADAKIDLDLDFKNITPHKLDGRVSLKSVDGMLNSYVMKKDFNIIIPKTSFVMNLVADLKDDDVNYRYILNSNLAKISSKGLVKPEPLALNLKYGVDIKELALLKPLSGVDLRGKVRLNGKVKGSKKSLKVDLISDVASSDTTIKAVLKEFKLSSLKADIKSLKLQKFLYMVKQPQLASGDFNLVADISNAQMGKLKGSIKADILNGVANSKVITKEYGFKTLMPKTKFGLKLSSTLDKYMVISKLSLTSTLANLGMKKIKYNLKDAKLSSDYLLKIADLNRLYFATERHLKGSLVVDGKVQKGKDLDFTAHSKVAGGVLNAKLHNDDFVAKLNKLKTLEILDMLIYPKIMKADIDGDLVYNLKSKKGDFKGKISNGAFTKNQMLDLVREFGHTDLYKQQFKGDILANINKEHILANLDLRSNTSSIISKNIKLNSKTKYVDAKVDVMANHHPFSLVINGNVASPKVTIDAQKIIEKELNKVIKKGLNKLFKKFF